MFPRARRLRTTHRVALLCHPWVFAPRDLMRDFAAKLLCRNRCDSLPVGARMRETHSVFCDEHGDVATASLLENWIDEAAGMMRPMALVSDVIS
jgi:hypothetical protein